LRSIKFRNDAPNFSANFVAPSATVVGKVNVGENSSIWYGAVLRGDDNTITIGKNVTVGDRVMIHCSKLPKEAPTVIEDNAVIGTGSILHGCFIEEGAVIGEGSQVLDDAKVGAKAVLAAGSFLAGNKSIPPRQLWAGVPARFVRELTAQELETNAVVVQENVQLAISHAQENAKTWQTIDADEFDAEQAHRSEHYYRPMTKEQLSEYMGEVEGHMVPGRVFDTRVSARDFVDTRDGSK
jgi:gamma-carbonic anhydrase